MDPMPHMRQHIELIEASTRPAKLETMPLPYGPKDLEPVISKATLDYHYEHLAKDYARRYNSGEGNPDFNRAGSYLHNKFFPQLRAPKSQNRPRGAAWELIESKFRTWEDFQEQFSEKAMKIQGSGWIYLSRQGQIKTIKNHAERKDIAFLIDMWEHSWAVGYGADKKKYLDNIWRIINWERVNRRIYSGK